MLTRRRFQVTTLSGRSEPGISGTGHLNKAGDWVMIHVARWNRPRTDVGRPLNVVKTKCGATFFSSAVTR